MPVIGESLSKLSLNDTDHENPKYQSLHGIETNILYDDNQSMGLKRFYFVARTLDQ